MYPMARLSISAAIHDFLGHRVGGVNAVGGHDPLLHGAVILQDLGSLKDLVGQDGGAFHGAVHLAGQDGLERALLAGPHVIGGDPVVSSNMIFTREFPSADLSYLKWWGKSLRKNGPIL